MISESLYRVLPACIVETARRAVSTEYPPARHMRQESRAGGAGFVGRAYLFDGCRGFGSGRSLDPLTREEFGERRLLESLALVLFLLDHIHVHEVLCHPRLPS